MPAVTDDQHLGGRQLRSGPMTPKDRLGQAHRCLLNPTHQHERVSVEKVTLWKLPPGHFPFRCRNV